MTRDTRCNFCTITKEHSVAFVPAESTFFSPSPPPPLLLQAHRARTVRRTAQKVVIGVLVVVVSAQNRGRLCFESGCGAAFEQPGASQSLLLLSVIDDDEEEEEEEGRPYSPSP